MAFDEMNSDFDFSLVNSRSSYNGVSDFGYDEQLMPHAFDPNSSITSGSLCNGMSDFGNNNQLMSHTLDPSSSITSGSSYNGMSDFSNGRQLTPNAFDLNSSMTSMSPTNEGFEDLQNLDFFTEDRPQFDFGLPWSMFDDDLDYQEEAKPTDPQSPVEITEEKGNTQSSYSARFSHHMQGPRGLAFKQGEIRATTDGGLELWDPNKKSWRPAVFHKDIREYLIASSGPENSFEHILRERRGKTTDITSFHPLYWDRREDRNHWPEILYQYHPTDEDFNKPTAPEWVLDDGRVVIDCINHIMYDFSTLPKTIASSVPGWLLVAFMRSNLNIHMQDIRGRIIDDAPSKNRDDPLGHNKLGMRICRFRKVSGCLTWSKSAPKDDPLEEYMGRILPKRCLEANSTKGFRDFYPHELKEIESKLTTTHKQLRIKNVTTKDSDSHQAKKAKESTLGKRKVSEKSEKDLALHDYGSGNEVDDTEPVFKKPREQSKTDVNHATVHQTESRDEAPHQVPGHPLHSDPSPKRMNLLSIVPESNEIKHLVSRLLTPTCRHFSAITEQCPPASNENSSYNDQVFEMQQTLVAWHVGNRKFGEPLELVRLKFLNDKVALWNFPWIEDLFGSRLTLTCTERQNDGVEWF